MEQKERERLREEVKKILPLSIYIYTHTAMILVGNEDNCDGRCERERERESKSVAWARTWRGGFGYETPRRTRHIPSKP